MKFTGKLLNVSRDWQTGKHSITFSLNEQSALGELEKIQDVEKLTVEAKQFREKRSLDANAYYWVVLSKIAEVLKVSKPFAHNYFLRKYGQKEVIGGKIVYVVIPDEEEAEKNVDEAESYHLYPTSQVKEGKDGRMYRTYHLLRGSSDYNTQEMAVLIDGLVTEAKELGIETLPPDELERMKATWKA